MLGFLDPPPLEAAPGEGLGLRVGMAAQKGEEWAESWEVREERAKRRRDRMRMGIKILHDFLHGLAPGLEAVAFEWLDASRSGGDAHPRTITTPSSSAPSSATAPPSSSAFSTPDTASTAPPLSETSTAPSSALSSSPLELPSRSVGPNPLLLDLEVPRLFPPAGGVGKDRSGLCGGVTRWFTAPPIAWPRLREVRLGGVRVVGGDVRRLKGRAGGLGVVGVRGGGWEGGVDVEWWDREWAREDGEVEGGVGRREGGGGWVWVDVRGVEGVPVEVDGMRIGGRGRGGRSGVEGAGGGGERKGGGGESARMGVIEGAKEGRKVRKEGVGGVREEVEEVSQEEATVQGSELELEDCDVGRGVESMVLTFILDTGSGG